ncbi:MAG: mandelate racemase/muconate lactonizing enzyme family protein [Rhizobiaceae bacterium]
MSKSTDLPCHDLAITSVKLKVVPVSQKTTWLFLQVAFSDGSVGFGEASYFGQETAVVADALHVSQVVAKEKLVAFDPPLARFRTSENSKSMASVLSALEQAMLMGIAQRAGLPLSVMLGGNQRQSVPVYANINRGIADRTPEGFAKAALAARGMGYQAVKVAPFDGLRWNETAPDSQEQLLLDGIARVAAVREAISEDCRLLVDCHWRFDIKMAARVISMLGDFKPYWLEDLVDNDLADGDDLRQLRKISNAKDILVAGGENVWTMRDALALLGKDGLDVMLPDLRQTGILQARSILDVAAAHGVMTSLHNPAGPVLDAVSVQMAAVLPDFSILERQVNESPIYNDLVETPIALRDGKLQVPELPGLGVTVSPAHLDIHSKSFVDAEDISVSRGGGPNA